MRILVVAPAIPFPSRRGAALRIAMMIRSLVRLGHEVHVVASHLGESFDQEGAVMHRIGRVPGVKRLRVGLGPGRFLVDQYLYRKTRAVVRSVNPELIQGEDVEGTLCGAWANRRDRVPLVYDMHNSLSSLLRERGVGGTARLLRPLERWLYRRSSQVIANWHASLTAAAALAPEVGATVIHDRLITAVQAYPEAPTLGDRAFVYCGNFVPYQRVEMIVEAFNIVAEQEAEARLVLVGGDPPESLQRVARCGDRVTFTGELPVAHTNYLLSQAYACVLAREGNPPMKLIHYLQLGRPVIGTENNREPGIFEEGLTGVLCRPEVESLANGMLRLLGDQTLRDRLAEKARQVAESRLSEEALDAAVSQVIEEAVRG